MDLVVKDQLEEHLVFQYHCVDRHITRGYAHGLFPLGGVAAFLKNQDINTFNNDTLKIPTEQLCKHIETLATKLNIPIQWWPSVKWPRKKDGGKSEYVSQQYLKHYTGFNNKILAIIADMERCFTVQSAKGKNAFKNQLCRTTKQVKFYYIYLYDEALGGLCYFKISTYIPFELEFYCNGHHHIEHNLRQEGIGYKMHKNSFTQVDDPARIQEIANKFDGRLILDRVEFWKKHFLKFNKGEYSKENPKIHHEFYNAQVEVCTNLVFKSASYGRSFFKSLIVLFATLAIPDVLTHLFNARPRYENRKTKSTYRRYDIDAVIKHWFRGNSVKMYNKCGTLLRIETTINHPARLGGQKLKKGLLYLQSIYWFGVESNQKYLDYCKQLDFSSISGSELDTLKQRVTKSNGKIVAAPDLRSDRQVALIEQLIRPKFACSEFRLKELKRYLTAYFGNSAQIRHEIEKWKVRGIVEKVQNTHFYRVTKEGFKLLWVQISTFARMNNPLLSRCWKNEYKKITGQTVKNVQAFSDIDSALKSIFMQLSVRISN